MTALRSRPLAGPAEEVAVSDPIGGNGGVRPERLERNTRCNGLGPAAAAGEAAAGAVVTSAIDNTRTLVKKQVGLVEVR